MNRRILNFLLPLFTLLAFALAAHGQSPWPEASVVRLEDHGGSGTVIATGEGWSLILSCAHCFEGRARHVPIVLDIPHPAPNQPAKVYPKLIHCGHKQTHDLALIRIAAGPLPYVSPVAPVGFSPGPAWSIGYDAMKFPGQKRATVIQSVEGDRYFTNAPPRPGRSGGGLIDQRTGYLIGVCVAYSMPKGRPSQGIYMNHAAVVQFLGEAGVMAGPPSPSVPERQLIPQFSPGPLNPYQPSAPPQFRQQPFGASPFKQPGRNDCPS